MKLSEIAARLNAELYGNGDIDITGVAGIEHARPDQITFIANPKFAAQARTTQAGAILVEPDFPTVEHTATLRIRNSYKAFAQAVNLFYTPPAYLPGIHPTAVIDPSAQVGPNAHIGAYAVIGAHVTIGKDAVILPHAVIYQGAAIGNRFFCHAHAIVREFCQLGDDVTLQNGAIVGADGFGFARESKPEAGHAWTKIVQSGRTILADRVEIQANACIDRASIGETRIGPGSKIDNLVQVGHGSIVGSDTLLCAQVGLAGSTTVGNNVILAGQVGVAGHCTIGDGAIATAQTGIPNDVSAGQTVSGYPAMDNRMWLRSVAAFNRLPDIVRDIRQLKSTKETSSAS